MKLTAPVEPEPTAAATETPSTAATSNWDDLLDTPPAAEVAAVVVAAEPEPEAVTTTETETDAGMETTPEPAAVESEETSGNGEELSDQAEVQFKREESQLQKELSNATMEKFRLQAQVNLAREEEKRISRMLMGLYARGPERLPLIDSAPNPTTVAVAPQPEDLGPLPPDAKCAKRVRLLKDIVDQCRTYGSTGDVVTAYVDADNGEMFLAVQNEAKESGWEAAYMDLKEYEVIDTEAQATLATGVVSGDDDSWKSVTIEALGIPAGICKILREDNSIETLGQIAKHGEGRALTDLTKIGESKAEKIQECMDKYWERRGT